MLSYFKKSDQLRDPFMIAEAGVNHEGSLDIAKRLIDEAKEGGAQAIKFQTYKAHTIASKHSPSYWDLSKESTTSQFELFKKYDSFWKKEYVELKAYCDKVGIIFLSTAFDTTSADFLNELMPVFKISSSDITNIPFIEYQCQFGKPIILSTGASHQWEIQKAVEAIEKQGNELLLMHCVLNYPTENKNANLARIKGLEKAFSHLPIGYSDHTLPQEMNTSLFAWMMGAEMIEKHFSHDKTLPGNDHYHAMDKQDLKVFFEKVKQAKVLMGSAKVSALPSEEPARNNARRSLVLTQDVPKGTTIEKQHLTWKRPAHGISPQYIDQVLGKTTLIELKEDDLLHWNQLN